jgi:hypothetical protein
MDISFTCSSCEQNIVIDEAGAGMSIECPSCGLTMQVPAPEASAPQPKALAQERGTDSFYLYLKGRRCGPFTQRTMQCKVLSGRLDLLAPCSRGEGGPQMKVRDFDELTDPYEHSFDEEALRSLLRIPEQPTREWVEMRVKSLSGPIQAQQIPLNEARTVSGQLIAANNLQRILEEMLIYERLGFKTITPLPSVVLADLIGYRDERIVECLSLEAADREQKLSGLLSSRAQANSMLKLLGLIEKYQAQIEDHGSLDNLKRSVFARANHLHLDSELESAKAADLSGDNKKAVRSLAKALAWASNLKVDDDFAEKVRSASEWLANLKSRT